MHIYFRGLKFIRFFAASLVVIHHIEQFKSIFGIQNYWSNGTIRSIGDKGVTLFFVLSGFLITFLLLKEKELTSTIKIKYFYIRRILRIWPLYFLIVLSSIFLFPHIDFFRMPNTSVIENNLMYILFLSIAILPNITLFQFGMIPFSSQAWSIGVEEQFYLMWPLLIKYVKKTSLILLSIIGFMFILQNCGTFVPKFLGKDFATKESLTNVAFFFRLFRIDCMAFGSLGGVLFFYKSSFLKYIYHPVSSFLVFLLTVFIIFMPFKVFLFDNFIQAFTFTLFILNVATKSSCFYTVETNIFNFLGDISYGIYMYHPLVCFTIIKLWGGQLNNFIIYILVFGLTFLLAFLSYKLFEQKLIKVKSTKFAIVKSN